MLGSIINATVFDGCHLLFNTAVVLDELNVDSVVPMERLPAGISVIEDLQGDYLSSGYLDLQVNGAGGVLFNDELTVDGIEKIAKTLYQFGVVGWLPTVISGSLDEIELAIRAVSTAITKGVPGVLGIHIEGPFLNVNRKGIHDQNKFLSLDDVAIDLLASLENGKTLVTLAPECVDAIQIRELANRGVVICAGHSEASCEQMADASRAGLTGVTHLFNAMPQMTSRVPGIVGFALSDIKTWYSIIADGHHVHPAALATAIAASGPTRAVLVTDCMPSVGSEQTAFRLNNETITVVDGRCVSADGTLAGSHLDMATAVSNTRQFTGLDLEDVFRMAAGNPARVIGVDDRLGQIRAGCSASLVALSRSLSVTRTWIDGRLVFSAK